MQWNETCRTLCTVMLIVDGLINRNKVERIQIAVQQQPQYQQKYETVTLIELYHYRVPLHNKHNTTTTTTAIHLPTAAPTESESGSDGQVFRADMYTRSTN